MAESIIKCLCGGTAHIETFYGLKTIIDGKLYQRYRFVCSKCKQGQFNISGSPTRQMAYDHYMQRVKEAKELAEEFDVSVSHFLMTVNR